MLLVSTLDYEFYTGTICEAHNTNQTIVYDDDDTVPVDLTNETWRLASSTMIHAMLEAAQCIDSDMPSVIEDMLQYFGNKPFLHPQAQCFPQYAFTHAYSTEEIESKEIGDAITLSNVPTNANIIASHVFYKLEVLDNGSSGTQPGGNRTDDLCIWAHNYEDLVVKNH